MFRTFVIAMAVAVASLSLVPAAHAADPQSIAIVDVEQILAKSKAAQDLQKQLSAKKESFQKEFAAKEKQLKETQDSLVASKGKLSDEEFAKKYKAYEEKVNDTRQQFQKSRNSLDQGLGKSMAELRKDIVEATASVADEKHFDIVLSRESVLIAEKTLDITSDVLAKLDAKVTSIPLKVE